MGLIHQLGDLVSFMKMNTCLFLGGDVRVYGSFLMHKRISQSDLAEVATQSVISEISMQTNEQSFALQSIKALSERFKVSADTFF